MGVGGRAADNAPVVVNQPFFVRIVIANDTAMPHDLWIRMGDSLRYMDFPMFLF